MFSGIDYKKALLEAKPTVVVDQKVQASLKPGEEMPKGSFKIYPPLNTNINFSSIPISKKLSSSLMASLSTTIPEKYSLRSMTGVTPVGDQMLCGSCWAFSTAQAISDVFVKAQIKAGNNTPKNPDLSVMYLLSGYPGCRSADCPDDYNQKYPKSYICGGGNPADLCKWIGEFGVSWNPCVNYDACAKSPACNGSSLQHFDSSTQTLNKLIPTKGCYINNKKHPTYFINGSSIENNVVLPNFFGKVSKTEHSNIVTKIKNHIMTYGTCVGGYHVLENFMIGSYGAPRYGRTFKSAKNPDGVYIDMVNYTSETRFNRMPSWKGAHAVSIIGWGVAKVDKSLIHPSLHTNLVDNKVSVPYWECRNSWGNDWNGDGYFKMAMYPYNVYSVFELSINIPGIGYTGGIISFKPGTYKDGNVANLPKNDQKGFTESKRDYFSGNLTTSEPPPLPSPSETHEEDTGSCGMSNMWNILLIIFLIVALIIIIMIYYNDNDNKKINYSTN